ncbi:hypothetical protein GCM10007880_10450 [Mesorhizobium amorphae]|nr:hypothetical protein GCM10007880_10450 [Mesorhizobium amorphae]
MGDLELVEDPDTPAIAPPAIAAIAPIAAADPSPAATPAAAIMAAMPAAMIDRLQIRLRAIVAERLRIRRVELIENAGPDIRNPGHRIEWSNRAGKGRRPRNAEHCRQE